MALGPDRKCVYEDMLDGRPLRVIEVTAMTMIANVPARVPVQCFYEWEAPDWPVTRLKRRRWLTRLLRKPTGLLFEEATFNQWFTVEAEDEDFTIALLGVEMQKHLLTKTSVEWTIGGGAIKLFYGGGWKKSRMPGTVERLLAFWELVPIEMQDW